MKDHTASRNVDALAADGYEFGSTSPATVRRRALEEIVEKTYEIPNDAEGSAVRIRELARLLHSLEPEPEGEFPRITGEDPGRDNAVRARAALLALAGWPLAGPRDLTDVDQLEEAIGDLVCDLYHLTRRGGGRPSSVESRAWLHFSAEEQEEIGGHLNPQGGA